LKTNKAERVLIIAPVGDDAIRGERLGCELQPRRLLLAQGALKALDRAQLTPEE